MSEQPKGTGRSLSIIGQVYLLVAIIVLAVGLSAGVIHWNEARLGKIEGRTNTYHAATIRHLDRIEREIFFAQKTALALHVSRLSQHERTGVYEHDDSEAALSDLTASMKQIGASFADVVEIQARFGGLDFRQTVARAEVLARRIQDDYETSLRTTLLEDEPYRRVARDLDAFLVAVKQLQGLHRISHNESQAYLIAQKQRNGLILVGLVAVALGLGGVTVFRLLQLIRRGLTQHARMETALRESEARYARAIVGANDGIWDWNIQTGELYFSPRWEEIVGYTPSKIEPVVQSFVDLVHPDDREIQAVAERNHLECRAPYDIEIRLRHRNGGYVWVRDRGQAVWSADGTPLRMAGSITDITEQKRAQAALRDSEASLANAQRIANLGNWDRNIVTGELRWSDQVYRIFGLEPQQIPASHEAFIQTVHPDDREMMVAVVDRALADHKPYDITHRIVLPDGEERMVHEQGEVVLDGSDNPVRMAGTVQDITERMRTEQINTRLGRIVEDSVNEIYVFDGDTLRFIQVNRGARENLGYSAEELRELSPLDLKPEYTAEAFAELVRPLRDGSKRQITFNTIHRRKDGTTYDVEVRLQLARNETPPVFFAVIQDITEQRRAQEALRDSEARYHAVVEDQPEMIGRHTPDGTRTFVNGAYCRFHGKSAEELLGQSAYEGMAKEDVERLEALYAGLTPENPVGEFEISFTGPEGEEIWQRWTKRAIYDGSGQVSEYQAVGRDITEQKRAEMEVRQLNETLERRVEERTSELRAAQGELLRQERLATLGRLTATVSHELRNPLGVIRTSAYTLRGDLNLETPRAMRSLERVERSVVRCDRIIEELLDFTRISGLEPEPTALDGWLDGVLEEQVLAEGIVLRRDFGLPGSTVAFDHDRFRRAVINVFENACQAMLTEGDSGSATGEHVLTVRTQARAGRVEVVFEDRGPGIPDEVYGRIYEPLFSTKGFGVGLGLPVVKQIMEQHGGGIEVETEEGHGTTVRLWLDPKANLRGVAA